jgi:hypothetical protein
VGVRPPADGVGELLEQTKVRTWEPDSSSDELAEWSSCAAGATRACERRSQNVESVHASNLGSKRLGQT